MTAIMNQIGKAIETEIEFTEDEDMLVELNVKQRN